MALGGSALTSEEQYVKMTQTPIPSLVLSMSVPTIISMLITSIYNMADTFFVSKLGTSASGAVGVVFPVMAIIQAIGMTFGMGGASLISRRLGEKQYDEANKFAATAFFGAAFFGVVLALLGIVLLDPIMRLIGSTESILPYARAYARYIFIGSPIIGASFVMNATLRAEGKAIFSMVGLTIGGLLNIGLDPLFIFVFDLGTAGAAIATIISQLVSFSILLSFFLRRKNIVSISPRLASRRLRDYWQIIKIGLPSFCRQALASVAAVIMNRAAKLYGDSAMAAISIVNRIFMFILSAVLGLGQGFQPVCGYNYGAKNFHRVRRAYGFTIVSGMCVIGVLAAVGLIFAPNILAAFRADDKDVIDIGSFVLRTRCIGMLVHPSVIITNMAMQSTGKSAQATFISICRQGLFFIPLILILPPIWGLLGIELSQPIADALSFVVLLPFMASFLKRMKALERAEGQRPGV